MDLEEYKEYICSLIKRLHDDKCMNIVKKEDNGREGYSLEFRAPEWFLELDEDIQELTYVNLRDIVKYKINSLLNEKYGSSVSLEDDLCYSCEENCGCCDEEDKDLPGWGDEMRETKVS